MAAFEALSNYYNEPLYEIAEKLGYDISNIYILKGDENALKTECPDIYANLLSCDYNRDKRTLMEYAQNLVASWIFEDDTVRLLTESGLNIQKAGADKERLLLNRHNISAGSDTKIRVDGKEIYTEIMCDYKGYWEQNNKADLRDDKYLRLKREKALFLGFDIKNKKYLLIDFSKPVDARYIQRHYAYGGKPAYAVDLTNQHNLFSIDYNTIARKIVMLARER